MYESIYQAVACRITLLRQLCFESIMAGKIQKKVTLFLIPSYLKGCFVKNVSESMECGFLSKFIPSWKFIWTKLLRPVIFI